jgi:pyruvate formate lyase activating enzyme
MGNGLRHVYTGNVHDPTGGTTTCTTCGAALVVRDWYRIDRYRLTGDGHCPDCNTRLAGVFDGPPGEWGRRRRPVHLAEPGDES